MLKCVMEMYWLWNGFFLLFIIQILQIPKQKENKNKWPNVELLWNRIVRAFGEDGIKLSNVFSEQIRNFHLEINCKIK